MKLTLKSNSQLGRLIFAGAVLSAGAMTPMFAQANEHSQHDINCDVALNYDVAVEPKTLTVSDKGVEQYRVAYGKLYVEGKQVTLNAKQQGLLNQYSDEISTQVPEAISLVNDAVEMASQAVSMALTPLLGDATGAKIDELMDGVQKRLDKVAYRNGDKYYLGATESSMENAFNDEFEQEMEALVQNSIGSIMMSIGAQMLSGDGGSFEEKMASFEAKMDNVGKDIETQMEAQAEQFGERAELVCSRFKALGELETQVHKEIPELAKYTLVEQSTEPEALLE